MVKKDIQQNTNTSDDAQSGGRTSLYFAPAEQDLLDFVNNQPVKRNKFIINLIRDAYERQKLHATEQQVNGEITNEDLLNEIKALKSFIENHSFKVEEPSNTGNNVSEKIEEVHDRIDDYDTLDEF